MGFDKDVNFQPNYDGDTDAPVSTVTRWLNVLTGILGASDNGGVRILNVDTQVATAGHALFPSKKKMTIFRFRMAYDLATTSPIGTQLKIMVFGRTETDGWQLLKALDGEEEVVITADPDNDIRDDNFIYTTPDRFSHAWDADGCDKVAVGIVEALASDGDESIAVGQAKGIN